MQAELAIMKGGQEEDTYNLLTALFTSAFLPFLILCQDGEMGNLGVERENLNV